MQLQSFLVGIRLWNVGKAKHQPDASFSVGFTSRVTPTQRFNYVCEAFIGLHDCTYWSTANAELPCWLSSTSWESKHCFTFSLSFAPSVCLVKPSAGTNRSVVPRIKSSTAGKRVLMSEQFTGESCIWAVAFGSFSSGSRNISPDNKEIFPSLLTDNQISFSAKLQIIYLDHLNNLYFYRTKPYCYQAQNCHLDLSICFWPVFFARLTFFANTREI